MGPVERRAWLDQRFPAWEPRSLSQTLDHAAARYGSAPLVLGERTYGYDGIRDWSRRLAAGLIALGVRPGDHVALLCANFPEFVAVKFAIARAGAICTPVNHHFRAAELEYVLEHSEARVLITMERFRGFDYLPALPPLEHVITLGELGTLECEPGPEPEVDPDAVCDVIYTSGTTGKPKGVMLSHDQVVRVAYAAAYSRALEEGRRLIFPMPLYHVFGYLECLVPALFVGGAIAPLVTFHAGEMLRAIEVHGIHEVVAVPAVMLPLLEQARSVECDLSSVHTVFCSGSAAPDDIWDDIREVFGDVEITTGYGMTETAAATATTLPEGDDEHLRSSNGRLRFGGAAGWIAAYKAVDPLTESDLPAGFEGHLLVRGPVVTRGYFKQPDETARAFTADGWLRTGDLGTISADGYLKLTGRLKETLRVGGELVMPVEIEAVLERHPAVSQAFVVGLPHVRMGEVPCAWVVPRAAVEPDELVAWCGERLARFKVPRSIALVAFEELPVTAVGRVQKFRLAELAKQRFGGKRAREHPVG